MNYTRKSFERKPTEAADGDLLFITDTSEVYICKGGVWELVVESAAEQSGVAYTHVQSLPSEQWKIVHNLGYNPAVTVVDSAGSVVVGDILYDSASSVQIKFSGAFSGRAYFS